MTHALDDIEETIRKLALKAFRKSDRNTLLRVPVDLMPVKYAKKFGSAETPIGLSFAASLIKNRYLRQIVVAEGVRTENALDMKKAGYDFCDSLQVRRPAVYQESGDLDAVARRIAKAGLESFCLKPAVGGKGAWGVYVWSQGAGRSVKSGRKFQAIDSLLGDARQELQKYQLADDWQIEELVQMEEGRAANDLKCYAFYGKCPLVLEVDRSRKRPTYAWWTRDGEQVDVGKYGDARLTSTPPDPAVFETAEKLSSAIPSPFCRIDFLKGSTLCFGEFSPTPGQSDQFSRTWDRLLGYEFVAAEARLYADLRKGRRHDAFERLFPDRANAASDGPS